MDDRVLVFCGDIHGDLRTLVWKAISQYHLEHADIVVLGDFGLGFDNSIKLTYDKISKRLEKYDITIYAIRGNHDNPSLFENDPYEFPRIKLLKDHTEYELGGRRIYTIPGACSTDIEWRKKEMEKDPKHVIWWEEEGVQQKPISELPRCADIIISHTAPLEFEPFPLRTSDMPAEQFEKILAERKYLSQALGKINCPHWFYGHFHGSYSGWSGKTHYRGLGILELCEAPEKVETNPQGEITI